MRETVRIESARSIMVIIEGDGHGDLCLIPRHGGFLFHIALMHPFILSWVGSKLYGWLGFFLPCKSTLMEKENSQVKPVKLSLKYWPCVESYWRRGAVYTYTPDTETHTRTYIYKQILVKYWPCLLRLRSIPTAPLKRCKSPSTSVLDMILNNLIVRVP